MKMLGGSDIIGYINKRRIVQEPIQSHVNMNGLIVNWPWLASISNLTFPPFTGFTFADRSRGSGLAASPWLPDLTTRM